MHRPCIVCTSSICVCMHGSLLTCLMADNVFLAYSRMCARAAASLCRSSERTFTHVLSPDMYALRWGVSCESPCRCTLCEHTRCATLSAMLIQQASSGCHTEMSNMCGMLCSLCTESASLTAQ